MRRLLPLALLALPFGLLAQALTPTSYPPTATERAALDELLTAYQTFHLDAAAAAAQLGSGALELSVPKGPRLAAATVSRDLFADDYRLVTDDGAAVTTAARGAAAPRCYRNRSGTEAAAVTVAEDFFMGRFTIGGAAVYVEPLRHVAAGAPRDVYLAYAVADLRPSSFGTCGVTSAAAESGRVATHVERALHSRSSVPAECLKIELALASDYDMYQARGSSATATQAYVAAVVNDSAANYDDEFAYDVQFAIVENYVSTSSSSALETALTASTSTDDLLPNFRTWAQGASGFAADYDLASLWVTRDIVGTSATTVGVAYRGGICLADGRYSLIEDLALAEARRVVVAHEFGHNFSLPHVGDVSKIMAATFNAASSSQSTSWATSSVAALKAHVDGASCGLGARALDGTPHAEPSVAATLCKNNATPLTDAAYRAPTSWSWSAPGGTLGSAAAQTTTVSYATTGAKAINLTSANAVCGSSTSTTESVTVTVVDETAPTLVYTPNPTNTGTGSAYGMGITNVTYGAVNHSSGSTPVDGYVYEDRSCSDFDTFTSYDIDVTFTTGPSNPQNVGIYVDSDDDGVLENYYLATNPSHLAANSTVTATLNLPTATTALGQILRMRIVTDFANITVSPTSTPQYGQVEDYGIILSASLPVELTAVSTTVRGRDITVDWSVASERNVNLYRVEHSRDGVRWASAGEVLAEAEPRYRLTDFDRAPGQHYYRVVSVDFDGTLGASDVVTAVVYARASSSEALAVAPNPTEGGRTLITVPAAATARHLRLADALGREAFAKTLPAGPATQLAVDLSGRPAGLYYLTLRSTDAPTRTLRVRHGVR